MKLTDLPERHERPSSSTLADGHRRKAAQNDEGGNRPLIQGGEGRNGCGSLPRCCWRGELGRTGLNGDERDEEPVADDEHGEGADRR